MFTRVGVISACWGMLFALPGLVSAQVPGGVPCIAEPTDQFVTYGDLVNCDITPVGDLDIFRLVGTAGERALIKLVGPQAGMLGCLELYRPDGTPWPPPVSLCGITGSGTVTYNVVLDQTGTWTMRVYEQNNDATMPYSLQIECLSSELCGVSSDVVCDVQLNQTTYVDGDTVTANVFRFANHRPGPVATEIKMWLGVPGFAPVSVLNAGSDGSVVLPNGFDQDFGPLTFFQVTPAFPRGSYELSCRILDPTTGRLLAADLNPFVIQ